MPHPTIAVLPFVNMRPVAQHEYISDGITDEIIHAPGADRGAEGDFADFILLF